MPIPAPRAGTQPRYLQLYEVLRARLEAGRWRTGDTIPSIPELMAEFGTARVTVRQALEMLETEGAIRKRRGVGTTVERVDARTVLWAAAKRGARKGPGTTLRTHSTVSAALRRSSPVGPSVLRSIREWSPKASSRRTKCRASK